MAQFNYARAQQTALRLLTKFGRSITIKRSISGSTEPPYSAYNPGPPTTVTYTATAACLPASKGTIEAFDNRLEGGTLIDENLRYVLMAPQIVRTSETGDETIVPKGGDMLEFDGSRWTILGNTPLTPAGTIVLHQMGARRS